MTGGQLCSYLLAFFLPPLGVFFKRGCTADLFINIALTLLGYIPGIIHAFYIIHKYRAGVALPV
ncbi:stress response RCI peptide [Gaertneriomyces semiglobifer]|nr:stress response RCI peptide [Gaertneriomyces semiglobifer]